MVYHIKSKIKPRKFRIKPDYCIRRAVLLQYVAIDTERRASVQLNKEMRSMISDNCSCIDSVHHIYCTVRIQKLARSEFHRCKRACDEDCPWF